MFIDKKYLLITIIIISIINCGKDDKVENKRPPESSPKVEFSKEQALEKILKKEQIIEDILKESSKYQSSNIKDPSTPKDQSLGLAKDDESKVSQKPVQPEVPLSSNKDKKVSVSKSAKQNDGLYLIIIILLSIATIISTVIAYYLYKWRIVVREANMQIMVPESFDSKMKKFESGFDKLATYLIQNQNTVNNSAVASSEKMDEMMQAYLSLQQVIDKKEEEIKRLREGYDTKIFKSFLSSFIKVDLAMRDVMRQKDEKIEDLEYIYTILQDALEECGVTLYNPKIGESIRNLVGIRENPVQITTDYKEKEYTIVEVIDLGYMINSGETTEIIKPARVKVYVPK